MKAVRARALVRRVGPTAVLALLAAAPLCAAQDAPLPPGQATYAKYCAQCHGDKGDGQGPAAAHLQPKPRDFTTGKYKLRTTPSGALPTDDDIRRVIRKGMPYTSMPGWPQLSDGEVSALVAYLKGFHAGFADPGQAPTALALEKAPPVSKPGVEKGRQLYATLGCARCHGDAGRGEGPSAPSLKDDKGDPIRAADLSERWTFRGGPTREDIFRTFSTGLNGTPMPSFFDSLKAEERWALTDYVYSLGDGDEPGYATVVVAAPLDEAIDLARADVFRSAQPARFPIVGQIMEPGRAFSPSVTSLVVRAVYDQQRIALLVRWHDARQDSAGKNDPSLEVPPSEEEPATPEAPAAGSADFWGEQPAPTAAAAPEGQSGDDFWGEGEARPAANASAAEFSDAVAVQLPLQASEGMARPYFLFGDAQLPVDVWFLDLAGSRVRQFVGKGSAGLVPLDSSEIETSASYEAGEWSATFARSLRSTNGAPFAEGAYLPIAFSVWDGTARERGSRRGLTQWVYVYLEPREKPSAAGPTIAAALAMLAAELLFVAWIRRRRPAPSGA